MNYPMTQKTGRLGEMEVERIFTLWGWTVGKDIIDAGYDLTVEPRLDLFRGHRFLVQVKATKITTKKNGTISALVSKERLRQYADNPIPVFVMRVSAEGRVYWIHVQRWAKDNLNYLVGGGSCRLKFDADHKLNEESEFSEFLLDVFKPVADSREDMVGLVVERNKLLSEIDPRINVSVNLNGNGESYLITPKSDPVSLGLKVTPLDKKFNEEILVKAVGFGLPAKMDFSSLSVTGTNLFERLGVTENLKGVFTISPSSSRSGVINLYSGNKKSIFSKCFSVPVDFYAGNFGFFISSKNKSIINLEVEGVWGEGWEVRFKVDEDKIRQSPFNDLSELSVVSDWAEQVIEKNEGYIELCLDGKVFTVGSVVASNDGLGNFLLTVEMLGKLHKISRVMMWPLVLEGGIKISERDLKSISLFYGLLKGEGVGVWLNINRLECDFSKLKVRDSQEIFIETNLPFKLCEKVIGTLPVRIDLRNYSLEREGEGDKCMLIKKLGAEAVMRYAPCDD